MSIIKKNGWGMVYEKAVRDNGSLFFPEKLTKEFLDNARRVMGSYIFANQYQNEIIPDDLQVFKQEWFRYYYELPKNKFTFAMIDPAIGQEDHHDFTGVVVIDVDSDANWYIRVAKRGRYTPTEIIDLLFRINDQFKPKVIGVESVAFQKAILYMASEEMKKRQRILPLKDVHPGTNKTKEMRISGVLMPRYEWNRIFHSKGLEDLETELLLFPRAAHDDVIDCLSMLDNIVSYPERERTKDVRPNSPAHPDYEKWFIRNQTKARKTGIEDF